MDYLRQRDEVLRADRSFRRQRNVKGPAVMMKPLYNNEQTGASPPLASSLSPLKNSSASVPDSAR